MTRPSGRKVLGWRSPSCLFPFSLFLFLIFCLLVEGIMWYEQTRGKIRWTKFMIFTTNARFTVLSCLIFPWQDLWAEVVRLVSLISYVATYDNELLFSCLPTAYECDYLSKVPNTEHKTITPPTDKALSKDNRRSLPHYHTHSSNLLLHTTLYTGQNKNKKQ